MMKQTDTQQQRTRKKGEVFSPAWVCNKMNNALDADWVGGLGAEMCIRDSSGTEVKVDGEECTIVRQGDILAVSYTHLDVYKRQVWIRA